MNIAAQVMPKTKGKWARLVIEENDSPDFIRIVAAFINHFCEIHNPAELCGIKIKNWFDHKWLNYSGAGLIPFVPEIPKYDVALTDFWKEKVTLPPFHRKRVISETNYAIMDTKNNPMKKLLHKYQKDKMNNRLERYSKDAVIFWYSSGSNISQKGSLMVYLMQKEKVSTFYISFLCKDFWKINKTKGIAKVEIEALLKG